MFSNNNEISMRQTFRLFSYDLIGMSTLLLPSYLAKYAGCDGIFAIFLGTAACLCYVVYLGFVIRRMENDILTYCRENLPVFWQKLILVWILLQAAVVAGYTAFVFSNLMNKTLLRQESFWLVLLVLLAIAGYGITGGIEGRARIYEVLFWFIVIPLFLMLLCSVRGVDTDYWTPVFMSKPKNLFKAAYLVFLFFGTVFWMLFLPAYLRGPKKKKQMVRCVKNAVVFAAIVLAIVYLILLGTFGNQALAQMDYPAVTFMSTVQIIGGFLKRADAFMLGVWFFTLFALLNTNLYYGAITLKEITGRKGNKRYMLILLALTFATAAGFYLIQGTKQIFYQYLWYIQVPLMIVIPACLLLGRKKTGMLLVLLCCCYMTGCKTPELEDRSFPMLASVEQDDKSQQIEVSYLYQPLEDVSDQVKGKSQTDTYVVEANDFYRAWHNYEMGQNKVVDYNHLKVMVLGTSFLENPSQLSEMLELLEQDDKIPRNTYVCVTDQVNELLACSESLPNNLGTYLEQLLENNESIDAGGLPTLGSLFQDRVNHMQTLFLPYFTVENEMPVWEEYYCIRRGTPVGLVSAETAYLGFLEKGSLSKDVVELENGAIIELSAFTAQYDLSVQGRVIVQVLCEGRLLYGPETEEELISQRISSYYTGLAQNAKQKQGIDVSNSYKKLGGYNRSWYEAWKKQQESHSENANIPFESDLHIVYKVQVHMTTQKVS